MNITPHLNSSAIKYLDIIVDRSKEIGYTNVSNGAKFVGYNFGFYNNGVLLQTDVQFYEKKLFFDPNEYSYVRILIYNKYTQNTLPSIVFNMKPETSRKLLDYIYVGNDLLCSVNDQCNSIQCTRSGFDCCSFVYYILNIPCCTKHISTPVKESQIKPGSLVFLNKKDTKNFHYGLYLGDGTYLSKFGTLGSIIFNDFKNLSKGFSVDTLNAVEFVGCQ